MRITWNAPENCFEAHLTQGDQWQADKDAAQAAGFHGSGPPVWSWSVAKAAVLDKLKANRPASGLTITREALDAYNRLHETEQKNDELRAYIKEQKKKLKREQEKAKIAEQREDTDGEIEPEYETQHYHEIPEYWKGKSEITRDDLPADTLARFVQHEPVSQRRAEPIGKCRQCGDNTYDPFDSPTLCFWCEDHPNELLEELIG